MEVATAVVDQGIGSFRGYQPGHQSRSCPGADKENSIMSQNINARSRMKLNATNTVRTEKRKSARSLLRRFLFQLKEYEDAGRVYNKI